MYDPSDLQPGDVVLVCPRALDPLGRLITWATVNPFSHAALVGDDYLIESLWRIEKTPLESYSDRGSVFTVVATSEQKRRALVWASSRLGQRYGITALLEDAERDVLKLPVWAHLNPNSLTCSGFVALAYLQAGVRLTWAPLPSPADLSYSPLLVGTRPWEVKLSGDRGSCRHDASRSSAHHGAAGTPGDD